MSEKQLIAKAETRIRAPIAAVWDALVNPEKVKQYMFGTSVVSDWEKGSSITWKGQWEGRDYEDKGEILKFEPQRLLQYSHFSPQPGVPDTAENYHTVTIELASEGAETHVALSQDNNATEQDREHSEKNWEMMLAGLKKLLQE